MKKIKFEIETITPIFLSGAYQIKAELRPASIKGLLRFWWRALQAKENLEELRREENRIFGSADEKEGGSSFSIRVITSNELRPTKNKFPSKPEYEVQIDDKSFKINILEYLSYGTYKYVKSRGNIFIREYYPEKTNFDIIITFINENWKKDVLKAVYTWYIFGGIGSRSRNGFGSFNIVNKEEAFKDIRDILSVNNPYTRDNLKKLINEDSAVSYPSFTNGAKLFRSKQLFNCAFDSLADIGKIYKECRNNLEKKHVFSERQYIGAPIVENKETKSFLERHAKPYFIKIAKENDRYRGYILYLPSKYCEGLEKDKNCETINHSKVNKTFTEVCNKFNRFLSEHMETII